MAPAMKLVLAWEEAPAEAHTVLKLTLPRKWKEGPTRQLKETFVANFNKKRELDGAAPPLDEDEVHLQSAAGQPLADADVVFQVLQPGEHVLVKPGPPPARAKPATAGGSSGSAAAAAAAKPTPATERVGSASALDAARKVAFDYSKWDRLDLSDEDGDDCHPNIDKESWKRLMKQKREDRRAKEDEKVGAFRAKIAKYQARVDDLQTKIDAAAASGADNDVAQLIVDREDAHDSLTKYESRLEHFLATRKLTADDVGEVAVDRTAIAARADVTPLDVGLPSALAATAGTSPASGASSGNGSGSGGAGAVGGGALLPARPRDESVEYDTYIKLHRATVDKFARLRTDLDSENFLLEHPQVLHEHAEGYLLLLTLDTCMRHMAEAADHEVSTRLARAHADEELAVARQHLIIQFVLALAKGKGRDPRDFVRAFFVKAGTSSAHRVDGFEDDLQAFVDKIRNRAREKRGKGEASPLAYHERQQQASGNTTEIDGEEYELAPVGPGGLDPNEVLGTLPRTMQEAFIKQDTDALRAAIKALSPEEATYHMKRCVDSGLWNPAPGDGGSDDEEEDEDEDDEKEEEGETEAAAAADGAAHAQAASPVAPP